MSTLKPIDSSKIQSLSTVNVHNIPPRLGPVRCIIKEHRCAWRGCTASTYYKFNGVPYCINHVIQNLVNENLELGAKPMPDMNKVPNGSKLQDTYFVEIRRSNSIIDYQSYEVHKWLEDDNFFVNTCIRYIETHHWDYAKMIDERTETQYKVTRRVA